MIEEQLKTYETFYSSLKDEALELLTQLRAQHGGTVDIHNINWRLKSVSSIKSKIAASKGRYSKLTDLQDIAGVRVVCHCK